MHFEKEDKTATKWLKEAQKGYMRIALLILLSKKPYHGYEMMKEVEDRTEGFWKPTAGGVYPILQSLENDGYIEGKWGEQKRRRKIYRITEKGRIVLDRALLKHSQIADNMNVLLEEYARDVLAVEPKATDLPRIPNPFSLFLDEKAKSRREALEIKRDRLRNMIETLQSELQTLEERLAALNQQKQKAQRTGTTEEKEKEN